MKFLIHDNDDGDLVDITFDPEDNLMSLPLDPQAAVAFDGRYSYADPGEPWEPIWLDANAAIALEEAGLLELTGVPDGQGGHRPADTPNGAVYLYRAAAA